MDTDPDAKREEGRHQKRPGRDRSGAAAALLTLLSAPLLVFGVALAWRWSPSEVKIGIPFVAWLLALGGGCYYSGRAFGQAKREGRRSVGGIAGIIAGVFSLAVGIALAYILIVVGDTALF